MSKPIKEADFQQIEKKIEQLQKQGKVFSNQDIYVWVRWNYRKGRWWTDKYVLPAIKWKTLKTTGYPPQIIGKYLDLSDLKQQLRSILNDYSV